MIKKEHLTANGLILEPNKKLGYYILDNEIYYNKYQALLKAATMPDTTMSLNNDPVRWIFNDHSFIKYPWHIEPEESIRELYKQRAQQLRDQYDYIRVEASGGADSTTVIFSFLLNGIHLDEVVFRYPEKGGSKYASNDPWDTSCENTLSEWEFAAKPLFQWISTHYPNTKITFHDYSDDMLGTYETLDESWVFRTRHYLQPGHCFKHTNVGLIDHRYAADTGLKIAVVYGTDKPKIAIKDGKFFLYFIDTFANHNNPEMGEYTNITSEFFYWTPDFPQLMAKQAHITKNWFSMPENNKFHRIINWPCNDAINRSLYEQLVKAIVYPDYDQNTFQTQKPTNNIYNEMDAWFHQNFTGTKLYGVWNAGIQYLVNTLRKEHVSYNSIGVTTGSKHYFSTLYYIGDSTISNNAAFDPTTVTGVLRNDLTKYTHCIKGKLSIY